MTGKHHEVPLSDLLYEFDRRVAPVVAVNPGDTVAIETEDAFSGQIAEPGDRRDKSVQPLSNPVSGPLAILGAVPGDSIRIDIREITPLRGTCATYVSSDHYPLAELGRNYEHSTRVCHIDEQVIHWGDGKTLPYDPMIGVIGTTPSVGSPTTGSVGEHGGNMDISDLGRGTTLWLPVFVPGALLYIGDCHASQGDGEPTGTALEMAARVTVTLHLDPPSALPVPRFQTPTHIGAIGRGGSLEEAVESAYGHLALWLEAVGWNRWEAFSFVSQAASLSVGYYRFGVVAAKIERSLVGG